MDVLSITRTPGGAQPVVRDLNTREASVVGLYDNCSDLLLTSEFSDFVAWDRTGSMAGCMVNGMRFHVPVGTVKIRTYHGRLNYCLGVRSVRVLTRFGKIHIEQTPPATNWNSDSFRWSQGMVAGLSGTTSTTC